MKVVGLLLVLFGGALFYLIGFKCYTWQDFLQEVANFTHLRIGQHDPGISPNPAPCPGFGFPSLTGK